MIRGPESEYFLAFDVETSPDVEAGRRLFGLDGLDDRDAAKAMGQIRLQQSGGDFQRLYLHRVVAIAGVLRRRERSATTNDFRVWSLGEPDASEKDLVEAFFRIVDLRQPTLVSWNGGGFDLPVLVYRALHHGVTAARYFETRDADFRFNNYLNRFHERHTDLMDILAAHQLRAAAPLDEFARFLGLPGKGDLRGADVPERFFAGDVESIRHYCEVDALLTWLIHLRFDRLRGRLDEEELAHEHELVRAAARERDHLRPFAEVGRPA